MPGSLALLVRSCLPFLPVWRAGPPLCPPPGPVGFLAAASEREVAKKLVANKRKRKLCRALLPILRGRWAGVLAYSRNRSSRRPVFPSELVRSLSLTLSLTLIR